MSGRRDSTGTFVMSENIAKDCGLNEEQKKTFHRLVELFFSSEEGSDEEYDSIVDELSQASPIFDALGKYYQHAISGVPYGW